MNNEVNTGNIKTEENIRTDQGSMGEEDIQKTIKIILFLRKTRKSSKTRPS